jgi:hypothetical protein
MFNPQARWDRNLPADKDSNTEAVEVTARFRGGKMRPLSFSIGARSLAITQIHFSWTERKGKDILHYYSVSDSRDTYCLCFSAEALSWHLVPISSP